jgi:hypothetical protein
MEDANSNGDDLRRILRKMRYYNPIPSKYNEISRNQPILMIIEHPILRDSRHLYFVQMADICAYFARQYLSPNRIVKKQGASRYYAKLAPIIMKRASLQNEIGMVVLNK